MMRSGQTIDEYVDWLKQQPKEFLEKRNEEEYLQTEKDYKQFVTLFKEGKCSICGKPLKTFSTETPCLHWLLRPKNFKKKHFSLLYKEFTYFRVSAYVRWVAALDGPIININDIQEEHPGGKLIDFTARYKHITWSFSCSKSDYEGHNTTRYGNFPHYHFQMKLSGKPFINYSNFHIPFHHEDLFHIELSTNHKDFAFYSYGRGAGMQELMSSKDGVEFIVDHSTPTDNPEEAAYDLSTIMMVKDGELISGDLIADMIDTAKKSKKTFASIVRERKQDIKASISTTVSIGDGVPKPQQRKGGRKKKK